VRYTLPVAALLKNKKKNNNAVTEGTMIQMAIDYVGDRRVPIVLVILLAAGLYYVHQWADVHYMPFKTAEASELVMMKKIDANGTLLKEHISTYEKNELAKDRAYRSSENKKAILVVNGQLFSLTQFEEVNGENSMTKSRRSALDQQLVDLDLIRECFVNGNYPCQ